MKRIISLIAIFLVSNISIGFALDYSLESGNYEYTEVITRAWKDGNYNGHYSGVPFLNKIGNEDILYYPYNWSDRFERDDFGPNNTDMIKIDNEIHAYKNGEFFDLGDMSYEETRAETRAEPSKYRTLVGTTTTSMLYIAEDHPSEVETLYAAPIRSNNLNYGKNNRNILYGERKLLDLEEPIADMYCNLSKRFLEKRLSPYNFAVSQKVNADGFTYNFAYITDADGDAYKKILFYYKNSRTNKYRYMIVPFSNNAGDMFIDIGFIDDENSPYNFYLIQSTYNTSTLHLVNMDFEAEDYEIREIPLSTRLFQGLDYCFNGNKAVFDRENKTIFYIAQDGDRFQRYLLYSTYIDLLNNTSSEPTAVASLSNRGNNIRDIASSRGNISAIEGIGITKQPYENKLAIITNYEKRSDRHHRDFASFQELGILEYELNLPEEEEGIYMDMHEDTPASGTDPMTPKDLGTNFKLGIKTRPPMQLSIDDDQGSYKRQSFSTFNQTGESPIELDSYVSEKLDEINSCFMTRYNAQLETINNAISKFEDLIEETDNTVMKNLYETTLGKLEEIREIFVNTYSW